MQALTCWVWATLLCGAFGCVSSQPTSATTTTTTTTETANPAATTKTALPPLGFTSLEDEVLYFVLLDRFANGAADLDDVDATHQDPGAFHGGDLAGLRQQLPMLHDLGVTSLWVSPLALQVDAALPHVDDDGAAFAHRGFHGYWAERFDVIDPHFGDDAALRALLDDAHRLGMKVVLDVVLNHPGYGASYAHDVKWTRSTHTHTCDGTDERTQCLFGLPDFRTESPEVADAIVRWTTSWAERYPFDGFRIDTLKHVDPQLVATLHERAEAAFRRRQPDVQRRFLMLGEWWGTSPTSADTRLIDDGVVDTLFEFSFQGLAAGFASGALGAKATAHHWQRFHEEVRHPLAPFVTTHDTLPFMALVRETAAAKALAPPTDDDVMLGVAMLLSTYGMPVLTYGDEALRDGRAWPHNRRCWTPAMADHPRRAQVRAWVQARRAHAGLRQRSFSVVHAVDDDKGHTLVVDRGEVRVVLHRGGARTLPTSRRWRRVDGAAPGGPAAVWAPGAPLQLLRSQASMWISAAAENSAELLEKQQEKSVSSR